MKKCQRCVKQATVHITEVLPAGAYDELHLCEACAKSYLYPVNGPAKSGKSAAEPEEFGGKVCPECGLKFVEFRNTGRFGCGHDYDHFREELTPLLESIHGDTKHKGKSPRGLPRVKTALAELNTLKKQLQQAVTAEQYETAAQIRDRIRQLEQT